MKKTADGWLQMAVMATLGTELYTKYVIVVDDDVDVFDFGYDVMWAVRNAGAGGERYLLHSRSEGGDPRFPPTPQNFTVTKMGIDAT